MNVPSNVSVCYDVGINDIIQVGGRHMFSKIEFKFSNFKSIESQRKHFCAKMRPSSTWSLMLSAVLHKYSWKLLAAVRAPLLPAAEPNRLRQSWEHLYSGHKGTMKRFLTAALCELPAATGSSECKLRTSTINKAMSNRLCTCSTSVCVCTGVLYLPERCYSVLYDSNIICTNLAEQKQQRRRQNNRCKSSETCAVVSKHRGGKKTALQMIIFASDHLRQRWI